MVTGRPESVASDDSAPPSTVAELQSAIAHEIVAVIRDGQRPLVYITRVDARVTRETFDDRGTFRRRQTVATRQGTCVLTTRPFDRALHRLILRKRLKVCRQDLVEVCGRSQLRNAQRLVERGRNGLSNVVSTGNENDARQSSATLLECLRDEHRARRAVALTRDDEW